MRFEKLELPRVWHQRLMKNPKIVLCPPLSDKKDSKGKLIDDASIVWSFRQIVRLPPFASTLFRDHLHLSCLLTRATRNGNPLTRTPHLGRRIRLSTLILVPVSEIIQQR